MNLTPTQLSQLRTRPHRTRLWLGIFRPRVIFSAQINQAGISKAAQDINVTALSGDAGLIVGGETCFISTVSDGKELGRIRVRSATSSQITVAENSINWVDGWYLTVVRYFEPWGVFPRIVLDADNVPVFFKDWDIPYTGQNQDMEPVVCLGPNSASFLSPAPSGTSLVWYTSSGSFDPTPGGGLSSYDWHFEGGDPTGSTAAHPGMVTYTGCGYFVTSLEITNNQGDSFTGRRHIQVLTRPEDPGSCKPYYRWGLRSLDGERGQGGYNARIWVRDVVGVDEIVDGALVVVFSEDWEGYVETKVGANAENRDSTLFVGYVLEDSIRYDPVTSVVDFKVGSVSIRMGELSTFSTALDDKRSAMAWTDMREMTIDRAIVHFLRWQSTVLAVADFSQTNDMKRVEFVDFGRGNIYEAMNGLLQSSLMASMVSDRQGKLWCELDANILTTGSSRQANDVMQNVIGITRQDWRREIAIERDPHADLAYIELGGIAYSGATTGTFDAYLSGAPGEAPEYFGSVQRASGLVIVDQDQVNELAGLTWAQRNALYPKVRIPLAGEYRFLDIAPQQRVEMTVAEDETFRRIVWNQKPFIPQAITYRWNPSRQSLLMDMVVSEETHGPPGDTVIIPVDPPYDRRILPDWDIDFPPIIPPNPIVPPIIPPEGVGNIIYLVTSNRLTRSTDFASGRATGSTWENLTPEWDPSGVTGSFTSFHLDPNDPANTAFLLTNIGIGSVPPDGPWLYRINDLNGITGTQSYTELLNPTIWANTIVGEAGGTNADSISISPINSNIIYVKGRTASAFGDVRVIKSTDGGGSWVDVSNEVGARDASLPPMLVSEKSIQEALVLGQLGREIWYTNVQGVSWSEVYDTGTSQRIGQLHVPFNANPADLIAYWSEEDAGGPGNVYITKDRFATKTIITPLFDGIQWLPPTSNDLSDGDGRPNIATWYGNRLLVASLMRPISGVVRHVLFFATDGVDGGVVSWLPRHQFPSLGGDNNVYPIEWHRTNPDIMAAIHVGDSSENRLYLSVDQGFSFIDGMAAWIRDIGTIGGPDNLGFNVKALHFVWTA
jgi:hypothetical protein